MFEYGKRPRSIVDIVPHAARPASHKTLPPRHAVDAPAFTVGGQQ